MVRPAAGFTLVEFLLATAVTLVALSVAVSLVVPVASAHQSLPEAADLQQRVRVAVEAIRSDLGAAGSGFSLGWGAAAAPTWPAVLPCRWVAPDLSRVAGGCAGSDSLTILSMASAAPQAIAGAALDDRSAPIGVAPASACRLDRSACRLHAGSLLLLADGTGAFDLFAATSISSDGAQVTHGQAPLSNRYVPGAMVGEVRARTYFLGVESGTLIRQLRRADSGGASYSVVDHVAALSFQYFGDPAPPAVADPGDPGDSTGSGGTGNAGSAARRTVSYGPLPPPVGSDNPFDVWPAGENCTFAVEGDRQLSRLAALTPEPFGLARLPPSIFADGPWCPDALSPNRYDADLLRIRLVRITIRLQAQSIAVRGSSPTWFVNPGLAREATRLVPDLEVTIDVAPRSLQR